LDQNAEGRRESVRERETKGGNERASAAPHNPLSKQGLESECELVRLDDSSGPGWIRTSNQGIMSPSWALSPHVHRRPNSSITKGLGRSASSAVVRRCPRLCDPLATVRLQWCPRRGLGPGAKRAV